MPFSCALEPLRLANLAAGFPLYSGQTVSVDGSPVRSSSGTKTLVDGALQPPGYKETLVIAGGARSPLASPAKLLAMLRRQHAHGVRILGVCGAVVPVPAAGLRDGLECAVDWQQLDSFKERFPRVIATDKALAPGKLPTAASGVSAADLMLQLIGGQNGSDVASLDRLAGVRLGVSVRQIERWFLRYLKDSPTRYYTKLRLGRARVLLRDTDMSVIEISVACGFNGASRFSKIYRKHFGNSPDSFRAIQLALHG